MTEEMVVAGTVFRLVLIWQIETGQVLRKLSGHTGVIFDVIFCFSGGVASVSDDRTLRFWPNPLKSINSETQPDCCVLSGHTSRIWRVRQMGECYLVTSSEDTSVRVWCLET